MQVLHPMSHKRVVLLVVDVVMRECCQLVVCWLVSEEFMRLHYGLHCFVANDQFQRPGAC